MARQTGVFKGKTLRIHPTEESSGRVRLLFASWNAEAEAAVGICELITFRWWVLRLVGMIMFGARKAAGDVVDQVVFLPLR